MTLDEECQNLMHCKTKIREYKQKETEIKNRIIEYLKNHNQEGVIFKHNNKKITLMVNSIYVKKNIGKKEKMQQVQRILQLAGAKNVEVVTHEILDGIQQLRLTDKPSKDVLKFKYNKN